MDRPETIRKWADIWENAAPELEAIRHREIREAETHATLALLEGAFNHAARSLPPRSSSGMVEMQRWFAKLRNRSGQGC